MMKVIVVFVALTGFLCGVNGNCGTCDDDVADPVCGYNGTFHTFQTVCHLKQAICRLADAGKTMKLAYRGQCRDASNEKPAVQLGTSGATSVTDKCSLICDSTEKLLICGTDRNTYNSKCEFLQAQCKLKANGGTLEVKDMGRCPTTDVKPGTQLGTSGSTSSTGKCNIDCSQTSMENYPICGTDGNTYQNKCYFSLTECEKKAVGERLDMAHIGACKTASSLTGAVLTTNDCHASLRQCDSTPQRICASDKRIYGSECEFLKAKCSNQNLTKVRCETLFSVVG